MCSLSKDVMETGIAKGWVEGMAGGILSTIQNLAKNTEVSDEQAI